MQQIIVDKYALIWSDSLQNVSKLKTYRTFKTTFERENYITLNLNKIERSQLAQLRFGILPLRIETGRYVGESPDITPCRRCNQQTVESEMHFLFECPLFKASEMNSLAN